MIPFDADTKIFFESNFFNLESDYFKILKNKNTIMHLVKY